MNVRTTKKIFRELHGPHPWRWSLTVTDQYGFQLRIRSFHKVQVHRGFPRTIRHYKGQERL